MKIYLNGTLKECTEPLSLLTFLNQINATEPFAVAVNQGFIARAHCAEYQLNEGDKIELLSPIQGG